jgi:hypothetical protein
MHLSSDPSDEEILRFIEAWVDDLARDDYEAAFRRTEHDPYYQWTPELMRSVVHGYGLPHEPGDPVFRVTPRQSAQGKHVVRITREQIKSYGPGLAVAYCNLPLNGEWSDLTASFLIKPCEDGSAVVLKEIHVF